MFKTRRQSRRNLLFKSGLLPFEAIALSTIPLKTPYLKALIQSRQKRLAEFNAKGGSSKQYRTLVMLDYINNHWLHRGKPYPWAMLRSFEDAFKAKFPEYTSPWEKRKRNFEGFREKAEKTVAAHYRSWMRQLDESIAKAEMPERKAQLEQQKKNLQNWL